MKKIILITVLLLFTTHLFWAQTPQKMSYQAVVRDASNALVVNQSVGMQISILQGSATGTPVYVETQTPTTNANGLVSMEIGSGAVVNGNFSNINWANGPYFIKTETDPAGGTNYTITGTSQLLSVPYALYAAKSDNSNNAWSIYGNAGTDPSTHFIGTTDDKNLVFKRNNVSAGILGFYNTALGVETLANNTSGYFNTATGYGALYSNTMGNKNTASGDNALYNNITGDANTALGVKALFNNTTGYSNVALGVRALYNCIECKNVVAVGDSALYHNNNTVGISNFGRYNTAVGSKALFSNTSGYNNIATGYRALYSNTQGAENIALGKETLFNNITGYSNVALGNLALYNNTTGRYNVAIGNSALYDNVTGEKNTALGVGAFNGTAYSNSTALGYGTSILASNQIRLGNNVVTSIGGYANWTNVSDARFKRDIQENVPGLSFIKKLRPVTYHLNMDAIAKLTKAPDSLRLKDAERQKAAMIQTGFIAQEVEQAALSLGYEFSGVDAPKNKNDYYGLRYAEFVVPLVKAMQEQQTQIERQEKVIEQQQKEIDELKSLVKQLLNKTGNK